MGNGGDEMSEPMRIATAFAESAAADSLSARAPASCLIRRSAGVADALSHAALAAAVIVKTKKARKAVLHHEGRMSYMVLPNNHAACDNSFILHS